MSRLLLGLVGVRQAMSAPSAAFKPAQYLHYCPLSTRLLSSRGITTRAKSSIKVLYICHSGSQQSRHHLLTLPERPHHDHMASGTVLPPNLSSSHGSSSSFAGPDPGSGSASSPSMAATNSKDAKMSSQNTTKNPEMTINTSNNHETTINTTSSITKSALLAQATSRILRLLVHIKWPLTRNDRPFSLDDFLAFASWVVMGHLLWFLLGTTTFVLASLYILSLAGQIGDYFGLDSNQNRSVDPSSSPSTSSSSSSSSSSSTRDNGLLSSVASAILSNGLNVSIEFEKGSVLPVLRDGMLRFKNVTIISKKDTRVRANAEHLNLSLSFGKWYEGNGVIDELEIFGMNGSIFRTQYHVEGHNDLQGGQNRQILAKKGSESLENLTLSLRHNEMANFHHHNYEDDQTNRVEKPDPKLSSSEKPFIDPDYILSNFKIRDSYIDIYSDPTQPPIRVLIFNCDISDLHGDRLLVGFFGSNNVTGAINDSMFTIHKHQRYSSENNRMVRFKLDGLDLGELTRRHASLKFNWIVQGKAEVLADILLPQDSPNETWEYPSFTKMFSDAFNSMFTGELNPKTDSKREEIDGIVNKQLLKGALAAIYDTFSAGDSTNGISPASEYVMVDLRLKLKNLQASLPQELPATSSGTPFISLHSLRKLIGFVNDYFEKESRPPLTIKTSAIEKMADLSNLGSITETTLFNVLVSEIYEDLRRMAEFEDKRIIEEKSVWSHSIASHLLLLGLGVIA